MIIISDYISKKPIFIVGKHRSGTTWLANILSNHSSITSVLSQRHNGIHESAFFSHVRFSFGDLNNKNNYINFLETFSKSDYFILTELKKEFFYKNVKKNYFDFFDLLMSEYAKKNNQKYWLEKSPAHSLYLTEISSHFKDAKFIAIERDILSVIKSTVKHNEKGNINIIKLTFLYIAYNKHIHYFKKKNNNKILIINFEDLKKIKK